MMLTWNELKCDWLRHLTAVVRLYGKLVTVSIWVRTQRKEGSREIGSLKKSGKRRYDVYSTSINIPHKTVTSIRRQAFGGGAQTRHFSRRVRLGEPSGRRNEREKLPEKLPLIFRCYRGISPETPVSVSKILCWVSRKTKTREWALTELTSSREENNGGDFSDRDPGGSWNRRSSQHKIVIGEKEPNSSNGYFLPSARID